jgi:nicotinamide mononucleotide (NMN) deamidase PncC
MEDLKELANTLLARAKQAEVTVIVAESCTAGLMSQILADAEGASQSSTAAS